MLTDYVTLFITVYPPPPAYDVTPPVTLFTSAQVREKMPLIRVFLFHFKIVFLLFGKTRLLKSSLCGADVSPYGCTGVRGEHVRNLSLL